MDEFDELADELLATARRIFDVGRRVERARIAPLLQAALSDEILIETIHREHRRAAKRTQSGYGAVSTPVRDALAELSRIMPGGVGAGDIATYFEQRGAGPDLRQVRAALKQLHTRGDAVRGDRGRYLSREASDASAPSGEVPDEQPSGLSLTAE